MHKGISSSGMFLAAVILGFSFWQIPASKWIIVVAAALIFLRGITYCSKQGKICGGMGNHKTGSELMMEKSKPIKSEPSKEEVKEVMKGKKPVAVKAKK